MLHFEKFHQAVSEARIEVHLQSDRNRNQEHMEKAPHDIIRLKRKNQYQRAEQGRNRDRREFREQRPFEPRPAVLAHQQRAQQHTGH